MRDEFSKKTKDILGSRVAYRCSFPGCKLITIGPGSSNNEHVVLLGEAAHIYSAAPNGPRNNPHLSPEERKAVENGIWMCKMHGRLIDVDETNYSAETLLQWKLEAENFVRQRLDTLEKENFPLPLTLIMLSSRLVLRCKWTYVEGENWQFKIHEFIDCTVIELREFISGYATLPEWEKYVVVESQGDGRVVNSITMLEESDCNILSLKLYPKYPRTSPHDVGGDIAMADDGDIILADGDLGMVHGIDYALQIIRRALSWEFGWWANPHFGSNFDKIYQKYHDSTSMLNSMVKLEIVRLMTARSPKGIFDQDEEQAPELRFINRVNWVQVQKYDSAYPYLPINLSLEWGNNEGWEGQIRIPFSVGEK